MLLVALIRAAKEDLERVLANETGVRLEDKRVDPATAATRLTADVNDVFAALKVLRVAAPKRYAVYALPVFGCIFCLAAGYQSFGPIEKTMMFFVTSVCVRRPGAWQARPLGACTTH